MQIECGMITPPVNTFTLWRQIITYCEKNCSVCEGVSDLGKYSVVSATFYFNFQTSYLYPQLKWILNLLELNLILIINNNFRILILSEGKKTYRYIYCLLFEHYKGSALNINYCILGLENHIFLLLVYSR